MSHLSPYTIHEAEFALFLADAAGAPTSAEQWIGGCLEGLSPEMEFDSVRLDPHGDPLGRLYHTDENHRISIRNLWVMEATTARMPAIGRNQAYVLVIVWEDARHGHWCKRTYYGVKGMFQGVSVEEETFYQDVRLDARRMVETTGLTAAPGLAPLALGEVRYVTASESLVLYFYDFEAEAFAVVDAGLLAGRAEIVEGAGEWTLMFGAGLAMRVTEDGLEAAVFSATGGTFPLEAAYPRVEFWAGGVRRASVTSGGEVCVPNLLEAAADPSLVDDFAVKVNGDWAASFAAGKLVAKGFTDGLA